MTYQTDSTQSTEPGSKPAATPLTAQQQQALATDRNISVTAGAGSGKTTILVERYLKIILEQDIEVRRVLAITFTEKAASEMTERVARKIDQLIQQHDADPLNAPVSRNRLLDLRDRLNSAQISTIHAFCARILREYAVASGIDPDFAIVTDLQRRLLVEESMEEVIRELDQQKLESDFDPSSWKELIRCISLNSLEKFFELVLNNPYEVQEWGTRLAQSSDDEIMAELLNEFLEALSSYVDDDSLIHATMPLISQMSRLEIERAELKDNGRQAFELMDSLVGMGHEERSSSQFWQRFISLSILMTTGNDTPIKRPSGLGLKKVLGEAYELIPQLSEVIHPLFLFSKEKYSTVPAELDRLHLRLLRQAFYLAGLVEESYRQKKEERGVLDFDDLQLAALRMLREHEHIRNNLRNRYSYVMVDEFQDTNQLQWEIISYLGTLAGELQENKFFIVGDPKQSIYGFRNADVRVFQQVKTAFAAAAADKEKALKNPNIVLEESFRFLPTINNFVNHLFEQVLGTERRNEFEVDYDQLQTRRNVEDTGYVELGIIDKKRAREQKVAQEDYIATTIRKLLAEKTMVYRRSGDGEQLHRIRPGDIAILIQRRTRLLELESTLRRYGIPFKTIGGVGFYRREEIFDAYHLLRFLTNPFDDLAFVALLRSPFAGISDPALFLLAGEKGDSYRKKIANIRDISIYPAQDQQKLPHFLRLIERWESRRDRISLARMLDEIFDESFYRATVAAEWNGEQLLANINKIIEQARDFEQGGFIAMADFIESLHEIITRDPREGEAQIALEDENTVKIMTIHQAKGLEFPVVFCPYLEQRIRYETGKLRFDANLGIAMKISDPDHKYEESVPFLYQWIDRRQRDKLAAELKRLFYVVVTRCRDRVYLVGENDGRAVNQENCLSWTIRDLNLDTDLQVHSEEASERQQIPIELSNGQTIYLTTEVDTSIPAPPIDEDIEPGLRKLEASLAEKHEDTLRVPDYLRSIGDTPEGVTFSATQLLTFVENPREYFRRYHLGFFESDYEFVKSLADVDNISLLKGNIVHKMLEHGLPESDLSLSERLDRLLFQFEIFDPELRERLEGEIPAMLRRFGESKFAGSVYGAAEWKSEISLTMQLGIDYFTGTLDRIYRNTDDHWEVLDYKTNNVKAADVAGVGRKYDMQMQSYALLMSQLFPDQQIFPVTLYFLVPGRTYAKNFNRGEVDEIKSAFEHIVTSIREYYPFGERMMG